MHENDFASMPSTMRPPGEQVRIRPAKVGFCLQFFRLGRPFFRPVPLKERLSIAEVSLARAKETLG